MNVEDMSTAEVVGELVNRGENSNGLEFVSIDLLIKACHLLQARIAAHNSEMLALAFPAK